MIQKYSFSFSELAVNPSEVAVLLGYPDGMLPEPFSEYLAEAMREAKLVCDIRGAISFAEPVRFSETKEIMTVRGVDFLTGKTVAKELRNSDSVYLFICTAGDAISRLSQEMLMGENPVLGYIYDILGSVTADAAAERMYTEMKILAADNGQLMTNRYSPGYCQWSVADQPKLFSFFPDNCCGIGLTDSALMLPVKSVSGIVGLGKEVKFREYTCDLCHLTECFYRVRLK